MSISAKSKTHAHHQASHSNVVTSVAFSRDGLALASGSWDGTVKLWDVRDGKPKLLRTYRGEWDEVEAVAFTPDGSALAGLGTGFDSEPFGLITLWPLDSARGRPLVREAGKIDAFSFAPDGSTLATASGDRRLVTLWDVDKGRKRLDLPEHRGPIWSVAYAPDGHALAVASGVVPSVAASAGGGNIGEVALWDLSGPEPALRARLAGHEFGIISLAFSADGARLASGGFDRVLKIWEVESGCEGPTLAGHEGWVAAVDFSPDGATVASGSHDRSIKLWDAATGRELATLNGHAGNVYSVAFSPDGSLLASGSLDGTVRLWDVDHALSLGAGAEFDAPRADGHGLEAAKR